MPWVQGAGAQAKRTAKPSVERRCKVFIAEVLIPEFLPAVRPGTDRNFPIDLRGAWHGDNWRFMLRYRVPETLEEFDAPFVRLEMTAADQFDVSWFRHTGKWLPMFSDVTLDEAFDLIRTVPTIQPRV